MNNQFYHGFYRGKVIQSGLPKGKCKIFIPSVYPSEYENKPDMLPEAEPSMSLFGGNDNSNGYTGWMRENALVWVFFEQGNPNYPVVFAACQGGDGWQSTNKDQFVYNTNKYNHTINDNTEDVNNITITGNSNENISNDENITIGGNQTVNITGNKDDTITGDETVNITGNKDDTIGGNSSETITGNKNETVTGNSSETITGNKSITAPNISLNGYTTMTGGSISAASAGEIRIGSGIIDMGTSIRYQGTQVVGAQGAAVVDATNLPTAISQLNLLLARCRDHGLIAP